MKKVGLESQVSGLITHGRILNDCITVWEYVVQECQEQYKKFADAA